ncbi:MAG: class I SAM-dependent methyltransferase [Thermoanaerobaculia bacterium]|nr:class I SAM-dependent methyltransferase [Thermoanaerobaculia bacterium]
MDFTNVYEDAKRAEAYDKLEFPGTYYLAYRDLPAIFEKHAPGRAALDFGCGTGRSTRFLERHGFDAVGVDISEEMVRRARERDPRGDYRVVGNGDLSSLPSDAFDLVLAAFTFDNIPTESSKTSLFSQLGRVVNGGGRIVALVSAPEIYTHEWASFTTKDFPENAKAKAGDTVKIIMTDVEDRRPVEDIVWPDEDYRRVFSAAGLEVVDVARPLGLASEPYEWASETTVAPWTIYVLGRAS